MVNQAMTIRAGQMMNVGDIQMIFIGTLRSVTCRKTVQIRPGNPAVRDREDRGQGGRGDRARTADTPELFSPASSIPKRGSPARAKKLDDDTFQALIQNKQLLIIELKK